MTVTGVTTPDSGSNSCVMPSFVPMMPLLMSSLQLDLDVDAGRQVEAHQRVDRLGRRLVDVDQPLVRADLEVLARVLVLEGTADHAVDVLLGRQRNGAGDRCPGPLRGLDDRASRQVDLRMVVPLQPDSDLLLGHCRFAPSLAT